MSNVPSASEVSNVMDTFSAIGTRRSIRWYEPNQPVEKWKVQALLEAARLAPSAGNFNGQRAIVVYRDEDPDDMGVHIRLESDHNADGSRACVLVL